MNRCGTMLLAFGKWQLILTLIIGSVRNAAPDEVNRSLVHWEQTFGGNSADLAECVIQTQDGGFALGGWSYSLANGNKASSNYGQNDFWLIRLDTNGDKLWDRSYGSNTNDFLHCVVGTQNGGFLLGGRCRNGTNGVKTSPSFGDEDFWAVATDAQGTLLWEKSYGGTSDDRMHSVCRTTDGGFLCGGISSSGTNGNKTSPNLGSHDFWVVRVNSTGEILWDKTYGGDSYDYLNSLQQTQDGGFVLGGQSDSGIDGTKTTPRFGNSDFWLVRLDPNGKQLWDRTLGGISSDALTCVKEIGHGGFILGGESYSGTNGNKTSPNRGNADFWVIRLDANGTKLWENTFGGSDYDSLRSLGQTADGGFVLGGISYSGVDGNKTSAGAGGWVVRIDAEGRKLWDASFPQADWGIASLQQTTDFGFILAGVSASNGYDCWVAKLDAEAPTLHVAPQTLSELCSVGFRFSLGGVSNYYVAEFSTDLLSWVCWQTNRIPATGTRTDFIDSDATNSSRRSYRVRLLH